MVRRSQSICWYSMSAEEVLARLESDVSGLHEQKVEERRNIFGWNEIPETGKKHWLRMLFDQMKSVLIVILMIAALISGMTGHIVDVFVIISVILINLMIGFIQEMKAERAVANLKSLLVHQAKVIRNGQKISIPARELVPGDIIVLEEGDNIPADARLIEVKNFKAIESPLTGESVPVNKHIDNVPENTLLADQSNMVRKGTFVATGYGLAVVVATGVYTAIGEIALSIQGIKRGKTNFQKKTDKLAMQMGIIAVCSAALLFVFEYFLQDTSIEEKLLIAIAALVSSIPEGLPAVLAIVLAIGANRMAKRNAIVREFSATETLGAVTTIITDKTGTLTQNTLTVRRLFLPKQEEFMITGEGWMPVGNFLKNNRIVEVEEQKDLRHLLNICAFCNNAGIRHDTEKNVYQIIGDPTEGALLVLSRKGQIETDVSKIIRKDDMPFSSERGLRATLVDIDSKKILYVIGSPERLLERSDRYLSTGKVFQMSEDVRKESETKISAWTDDAMRVIAVASKEVDSALVCITEGMLEDLVFVGIIGMIDPPRPEVAEAVETCRQAGIRVIMATGDHVNTAVSIAKSTGILREEEKDNVIALTEKQMLALDEREFDEAVKKVNVFARLTPGMKLRIAERLQVSGELIAMTGDGVNDAPALKKADVGVAMGIMGTDVARDAAKVVLADDNFSTIVNAIEEGRIVFTNARQTSFFLITTNFAEIMTLITAILAGLPVPLTATQILWLNLVTDGVGDISLATEKGHGDVLKEKPVNPAENILNASVVPFLVINAILMTALALGAFTWFLPEGVEKARSAAFITMAFSQLYNIFNVRSLKLSIFSIGMFSNKYINVALIVSILIQIMIIEVPFFERLFQFDPVSFSEFVVLAGMSSAVLWFGEAYKFITTRFPFVGK